MMNFRRLISTLCICVFAFAGYTQEFVHPLAIQETENTLIYFMNQDKEVVPSSVTYAYKRVAERKRKKKPYHVIDYFPNGSVEMETWMEHPDPISNRYEKLYVTFYSSGDSNTFIQYEGKSKHGKCRTFYPSGELKLNGQYLNDKPSGLWKTYYESGALKEEGSYLQGQKHGVWDSYHEIGNKSLTGNYVKGKKQGQWEQFHSTGDVAMVNDYKDGVLEGPIKGRYTTGRASEYGEYVNGKKQGEWNTFFENADKKSIKFYEEGVLEGNYMVLSDQNEELTSGEMYSNLFTGFGKILSASGAVLMEKYYAEGEVEKQVYYNEDGPPKRIDKLAHDGIKSICYDRSGNETACEQESYVLPHANRDLESDLEKAIAYAHIENYAPRGVYAFDVNTEGNVSNARVVESANADYDAIALEQLNRLSWEPGIEAAEKAVFSNHLVVQFGEKCEATFGDFYLNDSLLFKDVISHDPSLDMPDEYPSFRVGMQGLSEYMAAEIKYPETAKNEGVRGICIAKFAVEPSGVLSEIEIVGSVHPLLDYEAVRFLENMPKWIPGTRAGEPIKMYNHLPIRFTLN